MKNVFAPGCALSIYKPHLAQKLHELLSRSLDITDRLDICCRNAPELEDGVRVINVCPGCDRRYRENYSGSTTISLWEVLADSDFFKFPDYKGMKMAVLDACPTRSRAAVHEAVRTLLRRMNICPVEPEKTGTKGTCCGDSFWGVLPVEQVKQKMIERTSEMPADDVAVYCVSCCKSVFIGGKRPHYLVDLLFGEETLPGTFEPEEWHKEIEDYVSTH